MGLLDYYRQFEGMPEEEVNRGLREQAAERRRKALTRVETLDLSQTTWAELPNPRIVNAITFVAQIAAPLARIWTSAFKPTRSKKPASCA